MKFKTDIFTLDKPIHRNIDLLNLKSPKGVDIFSKAKKKEIFEQYQAARIFLMETDTDDWKHWFTSEKGFEEQFKLIYKSYLFQSALMHYNIIVDLSWVLCYVSAEYAIYGKYDKTNINDSPSKNEAYKNLRIVENLVHNPNFEENPFLYLRKMCPEFEDAINLIIEFWRDFSNSSIRNLYNYIKHKGRPNYKEIEKYRQAKLWQLKIDKIEFPTDIADVQISISLEESINKLKEFDDNTLFPYIAKLFELLEKAVDPSPLIL